MFGGDIGVCQQPILTTITIMNCVRSQRSGEKETNLASCHTRTIEADTSKMRGRKNIGTALIMRARDSRDSGAEATPTMQSRVAAARQTWRSSIVLLSIGEKSGETRKYSQIKAADDRY